MPAILRDLPYYDKPTTLTLPGGLLVPIKHDQIIVWVSISRPQTLDVPSAAQRFPAVLDTGFNDNFLVREQQLVAWAGIRPQELPTVDSLTADGQHIPLRDADVWLHPNRPGSRDEFTTSAPFCLELDTGIGVWPASVPGGRRLPLLGLRGLRQAGLQLFLDSRRCKVALRTPRRFWFLGW